MQRVGHAYQRFGVEGALFGWCCTADLQAGCHWRVPGAKLAVARVWQRLRFSHGSIVRTKPDTKEPRIACMACGEEGCVHLTRRSIFFASDLSRCSRMALYVRKPHTQESPYRSARCQRDTANGIQMSSLCGRRPQLSPHHPNGGKLTCNRGRRTAAMFAAGAILSKSG